MVHVSGDIKQEWEWDQQIEFLGAAEEGLEVLAAAIMGINHESESGQRRAWGLHNLIFQIQRDVQAVKYALTSQAEDCDAVPRAPEQADETEEEVVYLDEPAPATPTDAPPILPERVAKIREASRVIGDAGLKLEALSQLCSAPGGMDATDGLGMLLKDLSDTILMAQGDIEVAA